MRFRKGWLVRTCHSDRIAFSSMPIRAGMASLSLSTPARKDSENMPARQARLLRTLENEGQHQQVQGRAQHHHLGCSCAPQCCSRWPLLVSVEPVLLRTVLFTVLAVSMLLPAWLLWATAGVHFMLSRSAWRLVVVFAGTSRGNFSFFTPPPLFFFFVGRREESIHYSTRRRRQDTQHPYKVRRPRRHGTQRDNWY